MDKVTEAAKLNQLKYVFDDTLDNAKINELKTIGIGNFVDGANWMKEQMMKDAIVATVTSLPNDWGEYMPIIEISVDRDYQEGSKVKVLIIKEE